MPLSPPVALRALRRSARIRAPRAALAEIARRVEDRRSDVRHRVRTGGGST